VKSDNLRMIIGFAIIAVILIGSQFLLRPRRPAQPAAQPATSAMPAETAAAPAETTAPAPAPVLALIPAATVPETTVVLENKALRVEFTNLGGAIKSVLVKKYSAELVPPGATLLGASLLLADGPRSLDKTPMQVSATESTVTFTARAESLTITRTWALGADYTLETGLKVDGRYQGFGYDAMAGLAFTEKNIKEGLAHYHFYSLESKKLQQLPAAKLKKPRAARAVSDWVGGKSKYFLLALIGRDVKFDSSYAVTLEDGRVGFAATVLAPSADNRVTVYLGPTDYDRLRSFKLGLDNVVGLGIAKPVGIAMLWFLRLLFSIVRNWGVAIIIFSILMKAAFYPLTRTQTKQMRQMQLLQPKLAELKVKYKNDAQALNAETMQLYKLYKINPMSGCLPLLVQLPIFWGLYAVLRNAIELRGAPLALWLKDLAEPDTLFGFVPQAVPMIGGSGIGLLPVLMGVSFIVQNLLTSTDKKNWAMTIIFPIFITLIFLNMPSGLQLYWFMYNILSIVESVIAMKGGLKWSKPRTKPA
jgi:YidC/Oxa1 family membrane protein insertase